MNGEQQISKVFFNLLLKKKKNKFYLLFADKTF